jgi:hypothetical protein
MGKVARTAGATGPSSRAQAEGLTGSGSGVPGEKCMQARRIATGSRVRFWAGFSVIVQTAALPCIIGDGHPVGVRLRRNGPPFVSPAQRAGFRVGQVGDLPGAVMSVTSRVSAAGAQEEDRSSSRRSSRGSWAIAFSS